MGKRWRVMEIARRYMRGRERDASRGREIFEESTREIETLKGAKERRLEWERNRDEREGGQVVNEI